MAKSLYYFAFIDSETAPGVANKVANSVKAAKQAGFNAEEKFYSPKISSALRFLRDVCSMKPNIAMIRFSRSLFPLLFLPLLIMRFRGVKIIVDVPTPRTVVLKEFQTNIESPLKRFIAQAISVISGSWVLMPAHLIVQYADESKWFSLGVRRKSVKLGNGIFIEDSLPLTQSKWQGEGTLKLIGVAQLARWHGYDRLIDALAELDFDDLGYTIHFTVVGEGDALADLKERVHQHQLENHVSFTGFLRGEALNNAYKGAHIGVASLGLHRIGLYESSVLKAREYVARGLSLIAAGNDPDFTQNEAIRMLVSADEDKSSIVNLLASFKDKRLIEQQDLRVYAENNLTLQSKIKYLTSLVLKSC